MSLAPTTHNKRAWSSFGRKIGLAFQIADDLLDVQGDEAALGKRVGKDSQHGKLTFPGLLGIEESRQRAMRLTDEACAALAPLGENAPDWKSCALRAGKESVSRIPLRRCRCSANVANSACENLSQTDGSNMNTLLSNIHSPRDLAPLTEAQLEQLAEEMREALCNLVSSRTAHFASNLGVVELCLALHTVFDFIRDRLIWDTGHQIYPHKLITGRYEQFRTIRTKGGLMGYPNPAESPYDLFMTGHAGCSVSTALGLKSGDELMGHGDRHSRGRDWRRRVSLGHRVRSHEQRGRPEEKTARRAQRQQMSICPARRRLGRISRPVADEPSYTGLKQRVVNVLNKMPVVGDPMERLLSQIKDSIKAGLHGGMLFEELGFRYVGPVDGHSIAQLRKYLKMVQRVRGPSAVARVSRKRDTAFSRPLPTRSISTRRRRLTGRGRSRPFRSRIRQRCVHRRRQPCDLRRNAAESARHGPHRRDVPGQQAGSRCARRSRTRFFDTGICESHAVAFAAGQAKAGLRPIVDIYSTFLQRSFDQLFQEVALQNLPVTFLLDRAGLTGPDGPTHHGCFDLGYLRLFPNMVVLAPGDAVDLPAMLEFALSFPGPVAIRYPKAAAEDAGKLCGPDERDRTPIELARAEVFDWGRDGMILACGTLLANCLKAADQLRTEGLDVGVVNARFVKPLDTETVVKRAGAQSVCADGGRRRAGRRFWQRGVGGRRRCRLECGSRRSAGHARPLHRTRRARRTVGRFGP